MNTFIILLHFKIFNKLSHAMTAFSHPYIGAQAHIVKNWSKSLSQLQNCILTLSRWPACWAYACSGSLPLDLYMFNYCIILLFVLWRIKLSLSQNENWLDRNLSARKRFCSGTGEIVILTCSACRSSILLATVDIGVARIFFEVHFFFKKVDDLFSRRHQYTIS